MFHLTDKTNKYKQMKGLHIKTAILFFFSVFIIGAQQKLEKISKSVNASSDVTIDLNTSYTNIEIDTWNKNEVEVVAYIESSEVNKEELQDILRDWDVTVEGSGGQITIRARGGNNHGSWNFSHVNEEVMNAMEHLKFELADMPEIPHMPNMLELPEMNFEMPEMPELPELPELPEGVHSVNFDSKAYEKEGEAYLERWAQEYEDKYGKEYKEKMKAWAKEFSKLDFDSYSAKMEKWGEKFGKDFGEKFGKDMEKWGEEFSKLFDEKWAKDMEKWGEEFGEKFGKSMEKWGEEFSEKMEEREKRMEERSEQMEARREEMKNRIEERKEERKEQLERRKEEIEQRMEERLARRDELRARLSNMKDDKVKRTIKIKMPKDAKLKVNVRHGELKFSSVIQNLRADLEHTRLAATHIDGSDTSINASFSNIFVNKWTDGELELNYVEDAIVQNVETLLLNSNSSNIGIDYLNGSAIINGSFGDLNINAINNSFTNLNIILENSDARIKLPKTDYNVVFKGNRSKFNNESTNSKTIKNYPNGTSGGKTILVNAKYSNVIMQ